MLDEGFVFSTSCSVCLWYNELPVAPFGPKPWLFALCRSRLQLSEEDTSTPAGEDDKKYNTANRLAASA